MTRPIGGTGSRPSALSFERTPSSAPRAPQTPQAPRLPPALSDRYQSRFEGSSTLPPKPSPAAVTGGMAPDTLDAVADLSEDTKLDPDVQKTLDAQLALHPKGDAAREVLTTLASSQGFQGMKAAEQQKLLRYVGGTNVDLSGPARSALDSTMGTEAFKKASGAEQTGQLQKFLTDQTATPGLVQTQTDAFKDKRQPYTLHGPSTVKNHDFRGGKADAVKYEVEVGGKKVPVFLPKTADAASTHTIDEVAKGLAALPASSRALVKKVVVEGKENPDDAYWAKEYNDPNFSSYMTAGADGVISIYPSSPKQSQDYMDGTMIHETGHTLSMQKWGSDDSDKRWGDWKAAVASDGIVPSQYAKNSMGEDFGESLQLYQQLKGTPQEAEVRALMPERFKIIDELLAGKR